MSSGAPKWRLAEQARRERARGLESKMSSTQWHEIMEYLRSLPENEAINFKETALWYVHEWKLDEGVLRKTLTWTRINFFLCERHFWCCINS
jgi:hypothetical protein